MKTEIDNLLDEILKSDLPPELPVHFAQKVASAYARKMVWKQHLQEFAVYASVILAGIATTLAIVFFFGAEKWNEWKHFLSEHYAPLAGLLILALFILFTDKVTLPILFSRKRRNERMTTGFQ